MMPQENITIQPGGLTVYGDQHTRGDTDFHGHGPDMWLNVSPYVANEYQIGLHVYVKFMETRSDWTTFEGSFNGIVYDLRTTGGSDKILRVISPAFAVHETLNGHGTHHFDFGAGGIVGGIDCVGDSDGGVFGGDDHPQVFINFNPLIVDLQSPPHFDDQKARRVWNFSIRPVLKHPA
jgi:hypothetical protein